MGGSPEIVDRFIDNSLGEWCKKQLLTVNLLTFLVVVHHLPFSRNAPINNKLSTVNLTKVFLECLVVVLAVAQLSVDEADEFYGCLEAELLVAGTEDVLMEDVSHALLLQP